MPFSDVSTRRARIRFLHQEPSSPSGARESEPESESRALLLVHDALASHASFGTLAPRLAPRMRVVAPDLPGFGESEKPDPHRYPYGYDAFAESLFDLIAALGLGRVDVCGHGMGAGVALTLAAKHPSIVRRLVLVDALVYGDEAPLARAARLPVVGGLLWRQLVGRGLFTRFLRGSVFAGASGVPEGRLEELYGHFSSPAARQAAHATLVACADTRPLVAKMPRIGAETLVVWGRSDALSSVEHGRRLARELRGRFEVLECGRCPPEEAPAELAQILDRFLSDPAPRSTPPAPRSTRKPVPRSS